MPFSPVHSDATSAVTYVDRPKGSKGSGSTNPQLNSTSAGGQDDVKPPSAESGQRHPEHVAGFTVVWETQLLMHHSLTAAAAATGAEKRV